MKVSSLVVLASFALFRLSRAGDAASAETYARRNETFAPDSRSIASDARAPLRNPAVQEKRAAQPPVVEKSSAAAGDRRAAIDLTEERAKVVHPLNTRRPEARERQLSPLNRRASEITTSTAREKPPTVARYQDSLSAASATNMARFPALGRATTATINRFVFRKNAPDSEAIPAAAVTPAAGGSALQK